MRTYPRHIAKQDALHIPYAENDIRDYIRKCLEKYKGRTYYNKQLGVNIIVTSHSIRETMQNCRVNRQSAKLALYLPYILRNAKIIRLHLPVESKKQKERFAFTEIAELRCNVKRVGIAKLIIGYKKNNLSIEYSITNFQYNNKTSQFDF